MMQPLCRSQTAAPSHLADSCTHTQCSTVTVQTTAGGCQSLTPDPVATPVRATWPREEEEEEGGGQQLPSSPPTTNLRLIPGQAAHTHTEELGRLPKEKSEPVSSSVRFTARERNRRCSSSSSS